MAAPKVDAISRSDGGVQMKSIVLGTIGFHEFNSD
jgi:hypothetical protein